ncbi:MAG: excinuclease ABC subunit A [Dehalococcoidia bacterium]|nr:excinuclease ABC subunit A [Dehalococcoidia bacterium]
MVVKGAREHNLKNIEVTIPRNSLIVMTGVSGSGKSTLAFDTIYAEGQRRYVESLSSYARQFLGRMDKPKVDYIGGLSPAISIDQKGTSHNPRSTVGTVTEIYDYLRLLFARVGRPSCHKCGRPVEMQTVQQIVDSIIGFPSESRVQIMAPVVRRKKGEHQDVLEASRKSGFVRARINGEMKDLSEEISLDKKKWHNIEIIVDRLIIKKNVDISRVSDSVEQAMKLAKGLVLISIAGGEEKIFSENFACAKCNISLGEIEPRTFSFNNPHGACAKCAGLGYKLEVDLELVIPNDSLSLSEGAIEPWSRSGMSTPWFDSLLESMAREFEFSTRRPFRKLSSEHKDLVLNGAGSIKFLMTHITKKGKKFNWETTFEGVLNNLERRHKETESENVRKDIERYMTRQSCNACGGKRLKAEALAVKIGGNGIVDVTDKSISNTLEWVSGLINGKPTAANRRKKEYDPEFLSEREKAIADQILKEIQERLNFLVNIGLDYLTLSRAASTLSGGESQRIRLATQIGSGLTGVLYVCDEPSIGLHPADGTRLINTLQRLRDIGNTVIVVEHDEAIMRAADYVVDLGPGAGEHGGHVVATGPISHIIKEPKSVTGAYLSGKRNIDTPKKIRQGNGNAIKIVKAEEHNLKGIDVEIPLGKLVCITGASGSGKSTLINEILYKALARHFNRSKNRPGRHHSIQGIENLDKVVEIDQSPIGRTPRSNPATYTGTFTPMRELFASLPEAKVRGYKPGRFSFNVKGGRCEACKGDGYIQIEMQFLPDVTVPCEICKGARYNREALEVYYRSKSIADVLNSTVTEALGIFDKIPSIRKKLQTMEDVGLGYIRLGQPATTLSGGEAQRVKLATELSKRATGNTIYILDEPTTGLSFHDCAYLLKVLQKLVDSGNTVVLIEHHLDLIKNADWIIDLGPGAGNAGGKVVAKGTPKQIIKRKSSSTGNYLKKHLGKNGVKHGS